MAPKISVITAVHNGERYLREAIQSVLNQSFQDFEFIIVDDASLDATPEILASFDNPRIKRLQNEYNIGLTASLNRALKVARGEYVARQDDDDISLQQRLAQQVAYLDKHPEIGVLGTQMQVFDEGGEPIEHYAVPISHGLLAWYLLFERSFAHPTIMMRRDLLVQVGGYDESYNVSQDFDLWTRLAVRTRFANLPDALVHYRSHPAAVSRRSSSEQYRNGLRIRKRFASELLARNISAYAIDWLAQSQQEDCNLTETQRKQSIDLILQLYAAYVEKGIISSGDAVEVRADMLSRVLRAGRCGPSGDGLQITPQLQRFIWAFRNPWKAVRKYTRLARAETKKDAGSQTQKITPKSSGADPKTQSGISVVILSFERLQALAAGLQSLLLQDLGDIKLELLLVNNSPRVRLSKFPATRVGRLLRRFNDVKLINADFNWRTASRYAAATLARHETILFLDDDIVILDDSFLPEMYSAFQQLRPNDLLSCWNELWVDWTDEFLSSVSLDFTTPGITEIVPTDNCGPGICMFNKRIVQNHGVMDAVMRANPEYPKASDMGFSLISAKEHGSRGYFFPSYKRLSFHRQWTKSPQHARPGRKEDVMAFRKAMLRDGYQPIMQRVKDATDDEASLVEWAASNLPVAKMAW